MLGQTASSVSNSIIFLPVHQLMQKDFRNFLSVFVWFKNRRK